MDVKLAKCARCDKLFNKIVSEVCNTCQPDEEMDYSRIQDVLSRENHLNADQVAETAGVSLECVLRMLRGGRIDNVAHESEATCGRCGALAISTSKRLCQRCLVKLDRECAQAIHEMRQRLASKDQSEMGDVLEAVEARRAARRGQRREHERPVAPPVASGGRMVVPEHLRKK